MKKVFYSLAVVALLVTPGMASATVTVSATSLVVDPIVAKASSSQIGVFSVTLGQDAGETLSSVAVTIANNGGSLATGADFASVSVYKDNGNGVFEPGVDTLSGTQSTVNVGSSTVVTTGANNTINGGKFFVSIATSASWSDTAPADSVKVTLGASGIVTSANSPTITEVMTSTITADTTAPTLTSVVAKNTGGTNAKEAGDTIEVLFSEDTNKLSINAGNIASHLTLNNGHSFLDGAGALGGAIWSIEGNKLTLTLSSGTSVPSVAVGDTVTVAGSSIQDLAGNVASGNKVITGSFGTTANDDDDDDDDDDGDHHGTKCANTLINGRLYKIADSSTVYLAASCRLKPFRGAAVFHARGHKFKDIIELDKLPENVSISQRPVLPAPGSLVKGDDDTVWFVNKKGHKSGFVSGTVFLNLGFKFEHVKKISQSDLDEIDTDENIENDSEHPDGAIIQCTDATVFQVVDGKKFPFTSLAAFENRGNSFEHLLLVNCKKFSYQTGAPIED